MNLEKLRLAIVGVTLVFFVIVASGCAMDADEEQAPLPMTSDEESTDWTLLGNSSDMQHHSGLRHRCLFDGDDVLERKDGRRPLLRAGREPVASF